MEDTNTLKLKSPESAMRKLPILSSALTPEKIVGKLFSFHDKAHFLHLQTTSYAMHKNLDDLYKDLVDAKDSIAEYLLGIQAPKRLGTLVLDPVGIYSEMAVMDLLNEGFDFSVALCEYAEERTLEELCNMASDLQKLFVESRYLATLK